MTRYQTAVATLSMWVTKAQVPADSLLVRLWRMVAARGRHAGQPTEHGP